MTAKTARDVYNNIRRDFSPSLGLMPEVAKAMRSLSRVEQKRLLQLLSEDIRALAAILSAKKDARNACRFLAKLVANDLNGMSSVVAQAAERRDKQFFIELGKCLSRQTNIEYYDQLDFAIATLVCANPSIKAKDAVRELQKRGWPISRKDAESVFRMRKKRLRLTEFTRRFSRATSREKS
jgi:hypothetical protein